MLFPQDIEENEVGVNIRIRIGIHNNHKIIKEMHPLQEKEKEA
jgi:hypothetical protein